MVRMINDDKSDTYYTPPPILLAILPNSQLPHTSSKRFLDLKMFAVKDNQGNLKAQFPGLKMLKMLEALKGQHSTGFGL